MLCKLVVLGLALSSASAGSCPDAQPMANFDFKKYATGRWFEIGRYNQFSAEKGADCVYFDYTLQGDSATCVLNEVVNKSPSSMTWSAKPTPDAGNTAKLFYSFVKNVGENVNVNILDTDYDNYVVFYYCSVDSSGNPKELAWVKSRTPSLKPDIKAKVDQFLKTHPYVDETKMVWDHFTHDDCLLDV